MKAVSISDGVVPLEEFRDRPDRWLRRVAGTGEAVVLTRSGRAAGVLLSPGEFDRLRERQRFLESVALGLADAEAGRLVTTAELKRRLSKARRRPTAG